MKNKNEVPIMMLATAIMSLALALQVHSARESRKMYLKMKKQLK